MFQHIWILNLIRHSSFEFRRSIRVHPCASVAVLALLTGCASDFITDPTRPRPTRALESPVSMGGANNEVMGGPVGSVPFMTVEIPNNKDESPVVYTIAQPVSALATPHAAASQPASQPPSPGIAIPGPMRPQQEAAPSTTVPTPVKDELKIFAQQRPADQFRITRDNDANADLWVFCPSGIGTVTLERTADNWPALIRVHLRYDPTREFSRLEGFTASEVTPAGAKIPLKTTANKETAQAQLTIPGFARSPRIQIEWIDAYR